jgi:lysophospholipid acyltransferase (LPLAT)-like uncharacterized protein
MSASPQKPEARSQKLKSGVVIPNSPKWFQRLAAFLIWVVASLVLATLRYRVNDPHGLLKQKSFPPAVFCIWHNRLALSMKIYFSIVRPQKSDQHLAGLVSASKDGALLAAIFERFGVQPVRGSSSRRGAQALRELTTWADRGYDLAITPDGPRGPKYVVQEGAIVLAQLTGRTLVPVTQKLSWKISLKSWDHFQIPLPFSRCEITFGKTFLVPRETTVEKREQIRREFEAELLAIGRDQQ